MRRSEKSHRFCFWAGHSCRMSSLRHLSSEKMCMCYNPTRLKTSKAMALKISRRQFCRNATTGKDFPGCWPVLWDLFVCDIYLSPEDHLRYSSDTGTLTDSSSLSFRDLVGAATSPSRMGTSYPSKNVVQECKSPPDYLKTTSKSSHHVVKMW